MTFLIQAIIAFMALFITDICWAFYINSVKDSSPAKSAMWAVFLFLTGAAGVLSYTTNPWLLIPAGFGAFAGTYLAVVLDTKRRNRKLRDLGIAQLPE